MKKGLRLELLVDIAAEVALNGCPDEEGITTFVDTETQRFTRFERMP